MTAKESSTVPLRWDEVYYTNCLLVSASNVDQELGWTPFLASDAASWITGQTYPVNGGYSVAQ
jgi:NAD(P)-dependent dehydrogenase (short-subunit alcohol dehydrogenase family)